MIRHDNGTCTTATIRCISKSANAMHEIDHNTDGFVEVNTFQLFEQRQTIKICDEMRWHETTENYVRVETVQQRNQSQLPQNYTLIINKKWKLENGDDNVHSENWYAKTAVAVAPVAP